MRERYLKLMSQLVKSRLASGKDSHRDLFSWVIDAKDPEAGNGFTENELWAESRFLLIAG
jgi:cytochrome P450